MHIKTQIPSGPSNKPKPKQLFISHKSGLPVARNSISRWLKEVISLSVINITFFKKPLYKGGKY